MEKVLLGGSPLSPRMSTGVPGARIAAGRWELQASSHEGTAAEQTVAITTLEERVGRLYGVLAERKTRGE